MNTLELLDTLNGAIAEAFAPIIGKPKQDCRDAHGIVRDAIQSVLPASLYYRTWVLGPHEDEFGFGAAHGVDLFKLNTEGFEEYKGSAKSWRGGIGKWNRAPRYEVLAAVSAPTLSEVITRGMRQYFEKMIHDRLQVIHTQEVELENSKNYLLSLKDELAKYK